MCSTIQSIEPPLTHRYLNIMGDDASLPYAADLLRVAFAFAFPDEALEIHNDPDGLWLQRLPLNQAG